MTPLVGAATVSAAMTTTAKLEEAKVISSPQVALDFIGKRGSAENVGKAERVRYARDILQKEMLPHVGVEEHNETKKTFFLGYIVHRMLQCSLGREDEDDRDHYGNKRLDLGGPLLGGTVVSIHGANLTAFGFERVMGGPPRTVVDDEKGCANTPCAKRLRTFGLDAVGADHEEHAELGERDGDV